MRGNSCLGLVVVAFVIESDPGTLVVIQIHMFVVFICRITQPRSYPPATNIRSDSSKSIEIHAYVTRHNPKDRPSMPCDAMPCHLSQPVTPDTSVSKLPQPTGSSHSVKPSRIRRSRELKGIFVNEGGR
jgi:hypothetical protein